MKTVDLGVKHGTEYCLRTLALGVLHGTDNCLRVWNMALSIV